MKPLRDTPIKEGSNKPTEVKEDAKAVIEEPKIEEPKAEDIKEVKQEPKKASKKKK